MAKKKLKIKDIQPSKGYSEFDERLFNAVDPVYGSNHPIQGLLALNRARKGKAHIPRGNQKTDPYFNELFEYSLGKGEIQDLKYFGQSPYRPSKSTNSKAKYLRLNDLDQKKFLELNADFLRDSTLEKRVNKEYVPDGKGKSVSSTPTSTIGYNPYLTFGDYTVGKGEDEGGKYLSMYDIWDLKHEKANAFLDRKPEIYDRVYYSEGEDGTFQLSNRTKPGREGFNIPIKAQGGEIMAKKYKKGGQIPQYDDGGIAASVGMGALTGGTMGMALGPYGALGGAIIGGGVGLYQGIQADKAEDALLEEEPTNTMGFQMPGNQYLPTFLHGGAVKRKMPMGGQVLPQQVVELEQGEPFRKPDGSMASIKNDPKLSHKNDGAPISLEEGTQVLGNKKDLKTNMKFKEFGRKLAAQYVKYDKIKGEIKSTTTQNAAKAMMSKTQKKWDAAFQRQGVDTPKQKFETGGQTGNLENWMSRDWSRSGEFEYSNWEQNNPDWFDGGPMPLQNWMSQPFGQPQQPMAMGQESFNEPPMQMENWMSSPNLGLGDQASSGSTGINMTKPPSGASQWYQGQGGWQGLANTGMSLAGTAYNLIQGARPSEQLNASDYYNPQYGKSIDLMANRRYDPGTELGQNRDTYAAGKYNLQNSGASAGQQYAGFQGLAVNKMKQDAEARRYASNVNLGYQGQEAQMRAGLGAQRAQTNLNIKDYNMRSDAAGRNMLAGGFEGLGEFGQMQQLMSNQKMTDQQRLQILQKWYPNFQQQFGDINFDNYART